MVNHHDGGLMAKGARIINTRCHVITADLSYDHLKVTYDKNGYDGL